MVHCNASQPRRLKELGVNELGDVYKFPRIHLDRGIGIGLSKTLLIFQPSGTRHFLKTAVGKVHKTDTSKARKELGIEFRDLEATARETWRYLHDAQFLGKKLSTGDWVEQATD